LFVRDSADQFLGFLEASLCSLEVALLEFNFAEKELAIE
jgi:hypothetical protein